MYVLDFFVKFMLVLFCFGRIFMCFLGVEVAERLPCDDSR